MPFISKDWRSPGEEWVRYEGGWEKRKTVISVPGCDADTENRLSPSLDLAETDVLSSSAIPKKIFRRQASKTSSDNIFMNNARKSEAITGKNNILLIDETLDDMKENNDVSSDMEQDVKLCLDKDENNLNNSTTQQQDDTTSNIVAGCRPKIKTKPIIIPKSYSKNDEDGETGDIKPLKTRHSFCNPKIQPDRLSTTLPRNRSGTTFVESKRDPDIPSVDDFSDFEEFNGIDDEYEKINNPLAYHLKQHFRLRRRQRSQRSLSINETPNHHRQSDNEKTHSNEKNECDNNYDVRRPEKDNNVPIPNESRRRDSLNQLQRSSASPTSNIWMRLIEDEDNIGKPFYPITLRNTKEVAGFNGLAEALIRLDFTQAIRDVRRFNYVASLMQLLFNHDKLSQLPGAAQKVLFRMLEVVADTVYSNDGSKEGHGRKNEHVLRRLLEQLHTTMAIYHVWGSPFLGGGHLIKQHRDTRRKITGFVEKMQTEFKQDLAAPGLVEHLPEECIREILLRLNDPSDILKAGQSCVTMDKIVCEKRVWRELVQTHFTKAQIEFILSERPELKDSKDWQALHTALRRRYGIRQNFTEMLMLCRRCCALFWKSIGHPCLVPEHIVMSPSSCPSSGTSNASGIEADDKDMPNKLRDTFGSSRRSNRQRARSGDENQFEPSPELFVPVTPQTFLTFFSV